MTAQDVVNCYNGKAKQTAEYVGFYLLGYAKSDELDPDGEAQWLHDAISDEIQIQASCGGMWTGSDVTLGNVQSDADGYL